ncbi:MFS transporter, DHA1 family, inner membrane transport protein [Geodermatophilus pulveris]|uniref:MFS transporter, DHA1 family, inner membrane transport protein n=1 Tax=Geodermatophilus pulveris TaxID=1564159 RepID=A0A239CNC9_9ACTN|nr:MFS transporter [Geodermatophilus pulveris]SNS21449.1 MFS transporter, DHA1 family, inner membrane transport protein [Geodermatophilus pulveris]
MTSDQLTRPVGPAAPTADPTGRLPLVVYVLAVGTFLMLTTEFVVAGLLPEIAGDLQVSVAQAGLLITVFAVGMVVGAPTMALLTRRMPRRTTLVLALVVFAVGHLVVAVGSSFALLLAARFVTAFATGAFWAVASVAATRAAGPGSSARALGLVGAGGMLANVLGVPLGAFAGQLSTWRGPFWALAALALAAVPLIARHVQRDDDEQQPVPLRSELGAMRSGRLWLVLAACATTTGGVLSVYSFISPLLTDRAGLAPSWVPLVLVGFGVGSLVGTVHGGRLGDARPHTTTIAVAASTTVVLLALCLLATHPLPTVLLVVLLGLLGLSANPVLSALAVRFAGVAPTLGVAMSVAAYDLGTAIGSGAAGSALDSGLGATGPAVVGTGIASLTLVPTITIAVVRRRRLAGGRP